jgi:hypothetical protein
MKNSIGIRAKLLAFVTGIMLLMGIALSSFLVIQAPINRIKAERESLSTLSDALNSLHVEASGLLITSPRVSKPRVEAALAQYKAAFASIDKLKVIPALDPSLADALRIIGNVGGLVSDNFDALYTAYNVIGKDNEDLPPLNLSSIIGKDGKAVGSYVLTLTTFAQNVNNLGDAFDLGSQSLVAQFLIIDEKIAELQNRVILEAIIVAGILIALTALFAVLFANSISKTIIKLEAATAAHK